VILDVSVKEKSFCTKDARTQVLSDISFTIQPGSIVCLYGPSGCGKSTLLRIIAGLETEYSGHVYLNNRPVTHPTRDIGLTVQANISYDWLTVAGNITFGLRYSRQPIRGSWLQRLSGRVDHRRAKAEAERLASIVGLSHSDLTKYPDEISGGMKQRMAFARALLPRPQVLLLDEPFSSLDFESRQSLQEVVLRVRHELGTSFICVSHDPEEVLYLADEVLVLGGIPARIIHRTRPALPAQESSEKRYTQEFQQAKKELYKWLSYSTTL
jgi:ABC-type nitrate/sulfonate/bicarbonate transport system ATPase subunit